MKKIELTLSNDKGSIKYLIDAEGKTYSTVKLDPGGHEVEQGESGSIEDSQLLAERMFWVIRAALGEK